MCKLNASLKNEVITYNQPIFVLIYVESSRNSLEQGTKIVIDYAEDKREF